MGSANSTLRCGRFLRFGATRQLHRIPTIFAAIPLACHVRQDALTGQCEGPPPAHRASQPVAPASHAVLLPPPELQETQLSRGARRNVLIIGLTGVGKSETGNRMCRFELFADAPFRTSESIHSQTSQVQWEDVSEGSWALTSPRTWRHGFPPAAFRIIDSPGFFDTALTDEQVITALEDFAKGAREGLVAIVIVIGGNDRFTPQTQEVCKFVEAVMGKEAISRYGIVVATKTDKTKEQMLGEFHTLVKGSPGYELVRAVGNRVVTISRRSSPSAIYDAIEELFKANNYSALDCVMMNFARIHEQKDKEREKLTEQLRLEYSEELERKVEEIDKKRQQAFAVEREEMQQMQQRLTPYLHREMHHHCYDHHDHDDSAFVFGAVLGSVAGAALCCIQ